MHDLRALSSFVPDAQQGARANAGTCHASCDGICFRYETTERKARCGTRRAKSRRGSSLTLGKTSEPEVYHLLCKRGRRHDHDGRLRSLGAPKESLTRNQNEDPSCGRLSRGHGCSRYVNDDVRTILRMVFSARRSYCHDGDNGLDSVC